MQYSITFPTHEREALYDITDRVAAVLADSGLSSGLCAVYAQGARGTSRPVLPLALLPQPGCVPVLLRGTGRHRRTAAAPAGRSLCFGFHG